MYSRVYVEITNICNMNCSFCHGHTRKPAKMQQEAFEKILQQLSGKTEYIYYHLMGEPLTHPQLPLFLEMAAGHGFKSVITTNGTLLKKRKEELLASKLHKVSISIHSFEKADFESHRNYLKEVAEFASEASAAGTIVVLRLWNKGCDNGNNLEAISILQEVLPGDWTDNSRGMRIRDRIFLEWGDRFVWPDLKEPVQNNAFFCYGLKDHFGILCDGTVVPCCLDSDGVIALGNVFKTELEEILDSPRANAMRHGFSCRKATEELCRRCPYAQRFVI